MIVRESAYGDAWADIAKIFTAPIDAIATGWASSNAANAQIAAAQAQSNMALAQAQQAQAMKAEMITKYAIGGGAAILGLVVIAKVALSRRNP